MRAVVLNRIVPALENDPACLALTELARPEPGPGEVRLRISACGVCHTELDEIEGRTPPPRLPVVLGHEVVGRVDARGDGARRHALGARVGVGWIHHSCGGAGENVDPAFRATGRDVDGGYAEYMVVPEDYAHPLPDAFGDETAAPLLCAGAVGFRALRLSGVSDGQTLGLTGFGGSAHLVLQLARHLYPSCSIFVFSRDEESRAFARDLGAVWAGATEERAPRALDAIIDTTPAWKPVVEALANLRPGGRLVINAIRKEEADKSVLMELSYHDHLWLEKELKSVANVTAADIAEFLPLAAAAAIRPRVETYPLERAADALCDLKRGAIQGAKVLTIA